MSKYKLIFIWKIIFLSCEEDTTAFGKKLILSNFSRYKGDSSDIDFFQNVLLFVVEYFKFFMIYFKKPKCLNIQHMSCKRSATAILQCTGKIQM